MSNIADGVFPRQKILAENIMYIALCKHPLSNSSILFPYLYLRAGEEAERFRALTALTGSSHLVPRAHTWLLTTACNFSCLGSDVLFWPQASACM